MIREFYSNLSIYHEITGGHYLTSWIRGQEFTINKQTISKALGVPLVHKPTYPYNDFPFVDDIMSLLCGRAISWGTEQRINYCELTNLNSLYLRISSHYTYPILVRTYVNHVRNICHLEFTNPLTKRTLLVIG